MGKPHLEFVSVDMDKRLAVLIQTSIVSRTRTLIGPGRDVPLPVSAAVFGLQIEPSATFFAIKKVVQEISRLKISATVSSVLGLDSLR